MVGIFHGYVSHNQMVNDGDWIEGIILTRSIFRWFSFSTCTQIGRLVYPKMGCSHKMAIWEGKTWLTHGFRASIFSDNDFWNLSEFIILPQISVRSCPIDSFIRRCKCAGWCPRLTPTPRPLSGSKLLTEDDHPWGMHPLTKQQNFVGIYVGKTTPFLPAMTGNDLFIPPLKMVMTGGWFVDVCGIVLPTLKRVLDTAHGDWWVAHDGEMAWQFWHRPSNSDPHLTTISIHIQGEIHRPHPCFLYNIYIYI